MTTSRFAPAAHVADADTPPGAAEDTPPNVRAGDPSGGPPAAPGRATGDRSRLQGLSAERQELLSRWLEQRTATPRAVQGIPRRPDGTPPPLSFAQERMWFLEQYAPGTTAYTTEAPARLRGTLDPDVLARALRAVAERHESLRMRFPATPDGRPVVEVADAADVPLTITDVSDAPAGDQERLAAAAVERELARPLDIAAGPPLRAVLVRLAPDDHVLCVIVHHIVFDGWSIDVLLREVLTLYDTLRTGAPSPLPPLPTTYGDYAFWQRQRMAAEPAADDLAWWREQLAGVPPLALPTDRPYPDAQTHTGGQHSFWLDADLTDDLTRLGRAHRATPYMTLLAAFQALLARTCAQTDFAVGSPVAGRGRPGTEQLIGLFINTLVMRADAGGDPTFAELLGRVRATATGAYAHQELPFERVVADLRVTRDVRRPPVFQVLFALQNWGQSAAAGGPPDRPPTSLTVEPFAVRNPSTRHELSLHLVPKGDRLLGHVTYNADLFDAATIRRVFHRFEILLRGAVAAPDQPLSGLDLLEDGERAELLAWGDGPTTAGGTPPWTLLPDVLDHWVATTPDASAVVHGRRALTYRELDRRANTLARYLRACGVGPDVRVGVCLEQSLDLAVALLAVLRAGGAYLPLDPEQPSARLAFQLADADAAVLVTDTALRPLFDGDVAARGGRVVLIDADATAIAAAGDDPLPAAAEPDHLAYVIYTSGSTGTPKGVAVPHAPLVRYLDGVRQRLRIVPQSRFGLLQSLSFDFSVTMFYLALATGGSVHLIPRRASGPELAAYLARTGIDYLKLTPSHLAALAAQIEEVTGARQLLPRRALVLGGEASRAEWTRHLAGLTDAAVFNHYGPTEATVGVTVHEVTAGDAPTGAGGATTPVGRPLPYTRVRVLDTAMRPVPVGVAGELYLGGDRLARGYLGRPELTAERFVPDPDGPPGARLYRTGDLARWLPGSGGEPGVLEFLGRADHQIKLRGYRIEPGEVEAALAACPGVAQAVVVVRSDRLVAYLEGTPGAAPLDVSEVRRRLGGTLPEYMLPARVVWLDRLPLQAHGKVDRAALPEPAADRPDQATGYTEPDGPVERAIAEVWAAVLEVDQVGAEDDFFDLGGHSLLATQVISRLRRALPKEAPRPVTMMDLFRHPTVRALAAHAASPDDTPAALLHELTSPVDPALRALSLVCVPYGGASAVVYQPLADALPPGHSLYSVAVPGHDLGTAERDQDRERTVDQVAAACVTEILDRVDGPLAIYGHCGPGAALAMEIARRLEAAGRTLEAVYLGGIFPFARPVGPLGQLSRRFRLDRLRSDTVYANWLQSLGADVGALDADERHHLITMMRRDAEAAENYFTELLHAQVTPLAAPVVSVVGEQDSSTEFYQERYREWGFLTPTTALVVLDEAGHYFLKYRAAELAAVVTSTHAALAGGDGERLGRAARPDATWWLQDVTTHPSGSAPAVNGPRPSMGRFLAVAATQLLATVGTALTEFAFPIWSYLDSGSLFRFALFAVVGLLPGMIVAPVAGALIDRSDRRRVLLVASAVGGGIQGILALLVWTDQLHTGYLYGLLALLSVTLTFQRLAFSSAVPQLVPKYFLGNANGITQLVTGTSSLFVPLIAVALLGSIGLLGILVVDVAVYAAAIAVLVLLRFPSTMAWRRRETMAAEIRNGFLYFWQRRGLRAMLLFFVAINGFLAMVVMLVSPLVLTVGDLTDAGRVASIGSFGAVCGGLVMTLWGGPRHLRMRGLLWSTVAFAAGAAVVGLRPDLTAITAGAFAMWFALVLQNGMWFTIVHTKVPQRFHGRVIALNQMVAQTVCAVGFLLAPLASALLEPLLLPGGPLAPSLGAVIGVGPGRGIGLLYLACAAAMTTVALVAMRGTALATFDDTVPDAEPDDLVGLAALSQRTASVPAREAS